MLQLPADLYMSFDALLSHDRFLSTSDVVRLERKKEYKKGTFAYSTVDQGFMAVSKQTSSSSVLNPSIFYFSHEPSISRYMDLPSVQVYDLYYLNLPLYTAPDMFWVRECRTVSLRSP